MSQPYNGPADPMDRFEKLLEGGKADEYLNELRLAFQLGREQGHLEYQQAEYEPLGPITPKEAAGSPDGGPA